MGHLALNKYKEHILPWNNNLKKDKSKTNGKKVVSKNHGEGFSYSTIIAYPYIVHPNITTHYECSPHVYKHALIMS